MSSSRFHILVLLAAAACSLSAQSAGTPGAFTRMGFGGRGMGMGNAMTAVRTGDLSGFYNPSVLLYQRQRIASLSYTALSLDRSHNALFVTLPLDTNAVVSIAGLNAGVSDIDGRDIDGFHTEEYSTSENMASLSFALRIRSLVIGLSAKIFHHSLFKDVTSTTLGIDAGITYVLGEEWTVAAAFRDINSKYKWETSKIYGTAGNSTTQDFPVRSIVGLSYALPDRRGVVAVEYERTVGSQQIVRFGAEIALHEAVTVRAGLDDWDLDDAAQAHPSFGLTLRPDFDSAWRPSLTYAYLIEPYGLFAAHVITLTVNP